MSLSSFPRLSAILTGAVMTLALVSVSVPARAATVQEITSPGGLKAWLVEDYTVPIVTINAAFRGGAAQDPVGKPGLANLMSGLLDEGAGDLDSRAFQAKLEDLSINLNFDAGSDAFYSNLRTLSVNLDDALELFRLAVTSPRFDAEPVARIRGQIIANLRQGETNPNEMVGKLWAETLFKDHPYGWPVEGTSEGVAKLTAEDLKAFHARTMARDNLHVVIVGAIDRQKAADALDKVFGGLPKSAELTPVSEITPTRRRGPPRRAQRPTNSDPPRRHRPEARRSGLHRRLCGRPDPRRRDVLLAPLQRGAREARPRLFGRHGAAPLRSRRRLHRGHLRRRGERAGGY